MVTRTKSSDIIKSIGDALDFDADNETWVIKHDVIVFTQGSIGTGVSGNNFANNTLINHGKVYTAGAIDYGVFFDTGNARVVNTAGAEIFGSKAVYVDGGGKNLVNNRGDIIGPTDLGVWFGSATHGVVLNNHGYVFGEFYGVINISAFVGGTINNFHTIRSDLYAISINTASSLTTNISNAVGGVIKAPGDAILMSAGKLHLVNHGRVIGDILDLANVHDVIINPGQIKGEIHFGSGNDFFNGAGGRSGPILAGGGNDRIIVGKGNVKPIFYSLSWGA
jgi:hypothetical protein